MDGLISRGVELINKSEKILVFSGAGLSTESGIPDFHMPDSTCLRRRSMKLKNTAVLFFARWSRCSAPQTRLHAAMQL